MEDKKACGVGYLFLRAPARMLCFSWVALSIELPDLGPGDYPCSFRPNGDNSSLFASSPGTALNLLVPLNSTHNFVNSRLNPPPLFTCGIPSASC